MIERDSDHAEVQHHEGARAPILRHRDRVPTSWANGGGISYEVLRLPAAAAQFDVRLSVARVATDGAFSFYPGVDRILIPLTHDMQVTLDGVRQRVQRFTPIAFAGESEGHATLISGTCMDFNVMVRRGHVTATVTIVRGDDGTNAPVMFAGRHGTQRIAFALEGTWHIAGHAAALEQWDAMRIDEPVRLTGTGYLALVELTPGMKDSAPGDQSRT